MATQIDLGGQVILVTGASRGIGAAIARSLMEAGARVALHFRSNESKAAELAANFPETGSRPFQADLGETAACRQLIDAVLALYGRLDGLVNNAGIALMAPMSDGDAAWLEKWETTLQVNSTAPALLSRYAITQFLAQGGGGRLLHIASRAAHRGDTPEYMAYAASKGALVALHKSIARGFGKEDIKSFLIAPGFVRTDMAQDFMDEYGEAYALDDIALPQLTEPKDLGPLAALLMSGLADHATGTSIDVNAGSYVR